MGRISFNLPVSLALEPPVDGQPFSARVFEFYCSDQDFSAFAENLADEIQLPPLHDNTLKTQWIGFDSSNSDTGY